MEGATRSAEQKPAEREKTNANVVSFSLEHYEQEITHQLPFQVGGGLVSIGLLRRITSPGTLLQSRSWEQPRLLQHQWQ